MQGVATAVEALHEANFIHRDIKAANILIDRHGRPVVADLGLCRVVSADTLLTAGVGTAYFRSPEMRRGGTYDRSVDVYAIGQMLKAEVLPVVRDQTTATRIREIVSVCDGMPDKRIGIPPV